MLYKKLFKTTQISFISTLCISGALHASTIVDLPSTALQKQIPEKLTIANQSNEQHNVIRADDPQSQYPDAQAFTDVSFGEHQVKVPKNGFYDRYRMNPDLKEIAKIPNIGDLDFFKQRPKTRVETRVGQVWSPNYYYKTSHAQVLMLAPLDQLKAKLPNALEPIKVLPGYGLVSLTFYAYDICDNDPYDEVSVAIVVKEPKTNISKGAGLIRAMRNRNYYGYVLALPVDTEIARVRGVYGYDLPKWLTAIDFNIEQNIQATLFDTNGNVDVSLTAPTPVFNTVKDQSRLETKTMLNQFNGEWYSSTIEANIQSYSQNFFPKMWC